MDAKYIVRTLKFRCDDESGFDFAGSDEPYFVFTANSGGEIRTTHSKVFGDVDSGEQRKFDAEGGRNIVWPGRGMSGGAPAPIGLSVQLWENDQGDPKKVADTTEKILTLAEFAPVVGTWVRAVPSVVTNQLVDLIADDLMGSLTLNFSTSRLLRLLKKPGDRMSKRFQLGGNSGDLPFEVAGGPDYTLFIQVERTA